MFDFPNSPSVGQQIVEPNGSVAQWDGVKWSNVAGQVNSVTPAYNNAGRNLLHNPLFNIQQRGVGPWAGASSPYTADRWILGAVTDTNSAQIISFSDGAKAQIGDEAAIWALSFAFTGTSGATALSYVAQPIENVRRLAGKTVTVSFWAACLTGTLKFGINIDQFFGSGGSSSAGVNNAGQTVTLSTTWTRYSLTFTMPSVVGKTLGTNNNDASWLQMWGSAGSNYASRSGNVGVQSGTIQLWGVQLEVGTTATPLEKPDPQQDLAKCQRYYQRYTPPGAGQLYFSGYQITGWDVASLIGIPAMRTTPTLTVIGTWIVNNCTITFNATPTTVVAKMTNNAGTTQPITASNPANGGFELSADL